jgi:probable HAF family extracellular repeat protein
VTDLGPVGGLLNSAHAINDSGQVIGGFGVWAWLYTGTYSGGTKTMPGTMNTALGINASGQVVGWSEVGPGGLHAMLYSGGKLTDLGTLGSPFGNSYSFSVANGINDLGQTVGATSTRDSTSHAFL